MEKSQNQIIIGVDGGGTNCRAVIGTAAAGVLAQAKGGPANASTAFEQAANNVEQAIFGAAHAAGIEQSQIIDATAHVGLAGIMTDQDARRMADALPINNCCVTDDRTTAVAGTLAGRDGFMVSVGTGTFAARNNSNVQTYVGGWGFYVSDQASGAWLGRAILNRTLRCFDKMLPHTKLTTDVFEKFSNDPNEIVAFSLTSDPAAYAAFAPMLVEAAQSGDAAGVELLQQGAEYLTQALQALGYEQGAPLCLTGGLGPFYRPFLPQNFTQNIISPHGTATDGAFFLAQSRISKT